MSPKTWQIKDLLKVSTDFLREKGIENPRLNAELLLAHQLHLERIRLYLNFDQPLTEHEVSGYRSLIRRRVSREPLQYITGTQEFWSLDFSVDRSVLIPRPETEIVVEQALKLAREMGPDGNRSLEFLDLGTGSGAISVALAREVPQAALCATDISETALSVARRNAVKHQVAERIRFLRGDLWEPFLERKNRFDIVVSNPPYVRTSEFSTLSPEIRDNEPRLALDGGHDGMYYLKRIIEGAHGFLRPGGWIVLQTAPDQTEKALSIMDQTGSYGQMARIKDYSRSFRVVMARAL